jgi:hypothetical protein
MSLMQHIATKLALASILLLFSVKPALAGPPFVTDDPEPADYQHFEINTALQGTSFKGGSSSNLPNIDINYGLLPDTQFHVGLFAPLETLDGQPAHYGYGDTEVGLKYRFIQEDEEGWRPQVAIYPNIEIPTGNARQGLGAGHDKIYLPLWVQKSFGDWQTYGGGGYWLNQSADDKNYWFAGWALLRKFSEEWTLGVEVFHQTADLKHEPELVGDGISSRASSAFNIGGYYNLNEDNHIIFTVGRGLQNVTATNQFSYYVGYQVIY